MRAGGILLGLCTILAPLTANAGQHWGVQLDGTPLSSLGAPETKAVVLFFVATDCPISNRTFPEMQRLREEFAVRGVRIWYVYPNTTEHRDEIVAHQHAFDAPGEPLEDPEGTLVHLSHAVATPEMTVLIPDRNGWRPVYTGRIDNRFVRIGLERPAITEHFGEEAIEAVLAGRLPRPPSGQAVGCAIINPGVGR